LGIFADGRMLTTMHILVVEDERKVASFIKRGLEATHYSVDVEHDGEAGLNRLLEGEYDLVILDVMLPRLDGLSVMKKIRQQRVNVPILLLTARVTVADKSWGWILARTIISPNRSSSKNCWRACARCSGAGLLPSRPY
jgi:CheY-like chemotaxis protein